MSTRGVFGFRLNGKDKLGFIPTDSNPDDLGYKVLNFISNNSLDDIVKKAKAAKLLDDPDLEYGDYEINLNVNPLVLIDGNDALSDPGCEHAYILNIDSKTLEIYSSSEWLNYEPTGRYIFNINIPHYRGAALMHEIPFQIITPDSIGYHVKAIETAINEKYNTSNLIEDLIKANLENKKYRDKFGSGNYSLGLGNLFAGIKK